MAQSRLKKRIDWGDFPGVPQWLGLCFQSQQRGLGMPRQKTKIPHVVHCDQKQKLELFFKNV